MSSNDSSTSAQTEDIIENYTADESILTPEVIVQYLGKSRITFSEAIAVVGAQPPLFEDPAG